MKNYLLYVFFKNYIIKMDSQNPECNLHVESQRNASLENELFKVPFINRLYKMGNLHLKEFLVKPAQFLKTAFGKTAQFLKTAFGKIFLEDKTSLTRLINTMEKKSLVARIPSKLDKRINHVFLTKKGELLFKETLPIIEGFAQSLQENISVEEIKSTIEVIKKVQENLISKSAKSCNNN